MPAPGVRPTASSSTAATPTGATWPISTPTLKNASASVIEQATVKAETTATGGHGHRAQGSGAVG